jgi:hypothetical protein
MEELASGHLWLVLLGVAAGAFLLGRASSGSNAEARERRRLEEEQEVETALSRVPPSKLAEIDRLLVDHKKIEAIKLLRAETASASRPRSWRSSAAARNRGWNRRAPRAHGAATRPAPSGPRRPPSGRR